MKPRHIVLGCALLVSAALAAFGKRDAGPAVAEAVERPAVRPAARAVLAPVLPAPAARTQQAAEAPQVLALAPRETLIGDRDEQFAQAGQGAGGSGSGSGALFVHQDWTPPPPPPPPPAPPPPPPPPSAPPLPYTFIGKSVTNGVWEVYLARGDRTYVVHDKETIDGMYRVEAIAPPLMTLTYLPLKQMQQLNIGVFD